MPNFLGIIVICQEAGPDKHLKVEIRSQPNGNNIWEKKMTPKIIEIFTSFYHKNHLQYRINYS